MSEPDWIKKAWDKPLPPEPSGKAKGKGKDKGS
jgi:hypothetical protein